MDETRDPVLLATTESLPGYEAVEYLGVIGALEPLGALERVVDRAEEVVAGAALAMCALA